MANVYFFNTYRLKKGVSIPDFLIAVERLNDEHISKQKGYISFDLFVDGDTWADSTVFETMDDAKNFAQAHDPSGSAEKFYSFINLSTCRSHFFSHEKRFLPCLRQERGG